MAQKYLFARDSFNRRPNNSSLKEFSEKKIDEILDLFYVDKLRITDIRNKYLDISNNSFEGQLPYILSEEKCEKCGEPVYYKYHRKGGSNEKYVYEKLCGTCFHEFNRGCDCIHCETDRKNIEIEQKETFDASWKNFLEQNFQIQVQLEDISVYDELRLYLILKQHITQEGDITPSYYNDRNKGDLSNFYIEYDYSESISPLIERNIVTPSPNCNYSIATFDKEGNISFPTIDSEYPNRFIWQLNVYANNKKLTPKEYIDYIENEKELTEIELKGIWRDIYKEEVYEYIRRNTNSFIKIEFDERFFDMVTDTLIEDFSLTKAFALLYYSSNSLMRYKLQYNPSQQHLQSYLMNKIRGNAIKYQRNKAARSFDRNYNLKHYSLNRFALKSIFGNLENSYLNFTTKQILENASVKIKLEQQIH